MLLTFALLCPALMARQLERASARAAGLYDGSEFVGTLTPQSHNPLTSISRHKTPENTHHLRDAGDRGNFQLREARSSTAHTRRGTWLRR